MRAGWQQEIRLFAGVDATLPKRFAELAVTGLDQDLRWGGRDLLVIAELLMRAPRAEAYLLLRGDFVLGGPGSLRRDLEAALWPGKTPGPVVFDATPSSTGSEWQAVTDRASGPPLALVIPREAARRFVADPQVVAEASAGEPRWPGLGGSLLEWALDSGHPVHRPPVRLTEWAGRRPGETPAQGTPGEESHPDTGREVRYRVAAAEVSIVVPTWECGPFVRPCLNSLLGQTVHAEVIVVDDGSTDETSEILKEYAGRVRVLRHPRRQGANAARNTGIKAATGDFVALADADNEYSRRWLEKLLDAALSRPSIGVAYSGHTRIRGDGSRGVFSSADWDAKTLWYGNYVDMPSVVRRDALPEDGLPEGFHPFDDWRIWLHMASRGWIGKWVPEDLYVKRIRAEGKTRQSMALPHQRAREVALLRRRYAGLVGLETAVAVVVPACGCEDLTVKCLTHLADFCGVPFVVYYIDNGSAIAAVDVVAGAAERQAVQLQIVRNSTNLGFTRAVNQGIEASGEADVLVLNNDCFVGPNCVEHLAMALAEPQRVAAVGPLTGDEGRQSLRLEECRLQAGVGPDVLGDLYDPVLTALGLKLQGERIEKEALAFFCTLLSREALNRCGLLDERFESGLAADDEWCLRARGHGWQTLLALDAYAAHLHRSSFEHLDIDRDALQQASKRLLDETLAAGQPSSHPAETGLPLQITGKDIGPSETGRGGARP